VIGGDIVLVDGLLDQAQAKHVRVERQVLLRVRGDGGDVVQAAEIHGQALSMATSDSQMLPVKAALIVPGDKT
jgi:hypothetical protein